MVYLTHSYLCINCKVLNVEPSQAGTVQTPYGNSWILAREASLDSRYLSYSF
jgi:hypothetical protein